MRIDSRDQRPGSRRSLLKGAATGLLGAGALTLASPGVAQAAPVWSGSPDWLDITKPPFHADPTGRGDSTQAIQAALDAVAAKGGGVVYVPTGNFKLTAGLTYTTSSPLMITGDGPQASNLRMAGTASSIQYLTITQTGEFVGGNLGQQGTVIIQNIAFYNDQTAAAYTDTQVAIVMNKVNFGQVQNVGIYEGTASKWVNQGIVLDGCNQVNIDNNNIFYAVNGMVTTGYSQVNNLSNTSLWGQPTGVATAAGVLYIGQALTANMESVILHDGDRGILWTQDSDGNIPHLLFAYNVQPNNHRVVAMEFDYGSQVYLTECFFSALESTVNAPVPGVVFGPNFQGSAKVTGCQFIGTQGNTISLQGGSGYLINGCEIGAYGDTTYKYTANTYDEIAIGSSVADVTIDSCQLDVSPMGPGGGNQPRSALNVASGATGITIANCLGGGSTYGTAPIIDAGNVVMRNGNIGLGLADQTTDGGSTVTGTSPSDLSASINVPPYDMTLGTVYRFTAFGHGTQSSDGSVNLSLAMDVGGVSLGAFSPASTPAPGAAFDWTYTCYLAVTGTGANGTIVSNETFTWAGMSASHANTSFPLNTTQANAVVLDASWTAASGSPTITCDHTLLERLQHYPAS